MKQKLHVNFVVIEKNCISYNNSTSNRFKYCYGIDVVGFYKEKESYMNYLGYNVFNKMIKIFKGDRSIYNRGFVIGLQRELRELFGYVTIKKQKDKKIRCLVVLERRFDNMTLLTVNNFDASMDGGSMCKNSKCYIKCIMEIDFVVPVQYKMEWNSR